MSDEKKEGFKVTDKRASAQPEQEFEAEKKVQGPGWEMREEKPLPPLPPMDFTTFCLSLASSATIHLGLVPSPETGKAERTLPLAKQTIDILALLEDKTRGNLTAEESKLLATVLYDLRLRFVEASKASPATSGT